MSTPLFHLADNGEIILKLNNIKLATRPTVTQTGAKMGFVFITKTNERAIFSCTSCGEDVSIDQIFSICSYCGINKSGNELFKVKYKDSSYPGLLCRQCADRKDLQISKSLEEVLSNIEENENA